MPRLKLPQTIASTGVLLTLLAENACAHPGHPDPLGHSAVHGAGNALAQGWLHPFTGLDHLLAMVAVGILAVRLASVGNRRALWAVPATFLASMFAGGLLSLAGIALPAVELGILASVVVLGAMIAVSTIDARIALSLTAAFALLHGYAHVAEAASASAPAYAAGFLAATAALHAAGVLASLAITRQASSPMFLRASGALIAAAGIALAIAA
jgi:urease accessory protein